MYHVGLIENFTLQTLLNLQTFKIFRGFIPVLACVYVCVCVSVCLSVSVSVSVSLYVCSARNKDQKMVGHFYEDRIFHRLLLAVPLKMYRNLADHNGFWSAKC